MDRICSLTIGTGIFFAFAALMMAAAIGAIFFLAPAEASMGEIQRIFYVHVAVAWSGLLSILVSAACGAIYLHRRNLVWDHWSQAAAELGWIGCALVLITGSLWARAAWGTWWTWDPRLTTTFILWMIYSAYFLVRSGQEDAPRRARLGAVVSILGVLDLPLVFVATRWFRGIHPVARGMEPSMLAVLVVSLVSFTALFALLIAIRKNHLHQARQLGLWESEIEDNAESGSLPDASRAARLPHRLPYGDDPDHGPLVPTSSLPRALKE
jgi:heme exporter protein C